MTLEEIEEHFQFWDVHVRGDRLVGFMRLAFTVAIVVDVDCERCLGHSGYDHRYCYNSLRDAQEAMMDWDGVGEPVGFNVRKGRTPDYAPNDPHGRGKPLCDIKAP